MAGYIHSGFLNLWRFIGFAEATPSTFIVIFFQSVQTRAVKSLQMWFGVFRVDEWQEGTDWEQLVASVYPMEERDRIKRYRFRVDAKRSLSGHLLARSQLKKQINNEFSIARTKENKPYCAFKNENDFVLDFNVSHSGDYVVLGTLQSSTRDPKALGIDVEQVQLRSNTNVGDMESCFTKTEWKCEFWHLFTVHIHRVK
jgi:phosphopantetheinyl transferase